MPACPRCGDFTLLPDQCVDCGKLGPAATATAPAAAAPVVATVPAYRPRADQWDMLGTARAPHRVAPPVAAVPHMSHGYPPGPVGPWAAPPQRLPARDPFASLGRRVVAYLLDSVLMSVLLVVITVVGTVSGSEGASWTFALVGWVAVLALYWYVPTSRSGRTVGKLALGIRVVRADDLVSPPGYGYGAVRCLVETCLGLVPLGNLINLVVAGTDTTERRAVHDRAAGTRVVKADWSPAEGYPLVTRRTPSAASIVVISLACAVAGLLVVSILAAVVIPVFLNQRVKAVDAQMRQDAAAAAETLVNARGRLTFPIVIDEGTVGFVGSSTLEPAPGDSIRITAARDGSGAFCVRVDHDSAPDPLFLDSVAGTISTTPCGYRGRTTVDVR